MRITRRTLVAVVGAIAASIVVVVSPTIGRSSAEPQAREGPRAASADDGAIDAYLARAREESGIPGLAFALVRPGQPTHLLVLGRADDGGRPITPQTPFLLASTSKAFTATAVMQLVEAGALDLDAPVQRYLPWFEVADAATAAQITLRHLLVQTSGFTTRQGIAYQAGDDQDDGALERGVRNLATAQLDSAPGEAHQYSNVNYDILGLVVQAVSGQPFDRYLADHVYGPLGMEHSHAARDAARADGLADGYYPWFGTAWRQTYMSLPRTGAPSATTYSSAEDMGRWVAANLAGGVLGETRIVSEEGMATLHRPAVAVDEFHAYAMGWSVRPLWEALDMTADGAATDSYRLPVLIEHGGSWPNAHTYVGLVPAEDWGFALLVNAGDETEDRLSPIEQNVLRLLAGLDPTVIPATLEPLVAYRFVVVVGILVAEIVSLAWALRTLWRRRRAAAGAAGPSTRRVAIGLVVALALDVFVAWFYVVYTPDHFEADLAVLLRSVPDAALFIVPSLALALVWGPVRTALLAWSLVRHGSAHGGDLSRI